MTAKRYLIVPLAGVALVGVGCGSSSSSSTSKSASHKSTTMTKTESMPMTETSTSMAMSGSGGHTVASMVAMGMTPEHAEVTVASSPHYGSVLYDKDHFALYVFSGVIPIFNMAATVCPPLPVIAIDVLVSVIGMLL